MTERLQVKVVATKKGHATHAVVIAERKKEEIEDTDEHICEECVIVEPRGLHVMLSGGTTIV
eukprot:902478-Ditylum_brightwellii.AAC.1